LKKEIFKNKYNKMITQIIANSYVLKQFSKIDIFKKDLGNNLTGAFDPKNKSRGEGMKIKISDEFIKKYKSVTGSIIFKYGFIGNLNFYQDQTLHNNEFVAFENEKIYEIEIDKPEDLINDPGEYLGYIVEQIENNGKEEHVEKHFSSVPEEIETPDISMYRDAYIEAMVERRRKLSPINENDENLQEIIKKRKKRHEK